MGRMRLMHESSHASFVSRAESSAKFVNAARMMYPAEPTS